jgi:hypothetical protein
MLISPVNSKVIIFHSGSPLLLTSWLTERSSRGGDSRMVSLTSLLSFTHLVGLALAVGAGTVKLGLLLRCNADPSFVPVYLSVARPVTRHIIVGLVLLIASGIGFLLVGYALTSRLVVKLILVGAILVLGPFIDNRIEPRFFKLAPAPGEAPSPAFVRIQRQYLTLEIVADALFYLILVIWVLI